MTGMMRRSRSKAYQVGRAFSHCARNYLLSRYGMSKTMHAIWSRPRPKSPALAVPPLPQTEPGPQHVQHPAKPVKPVPDPGI